MREHANSSLHLARLPINGCFAFIFGDSLVRMGDAPMFFATKHEARAAARQQNVLVRPDGRCE